VFPPSSFLLHNFFVVLLALLVPAFFVPTATADDKPWRISFAHVWFRNRSIPVTEVSVWTKTFYRKPDGTTLESIGMNFNSSQATVVPLLQTALEYFFKSPTPYYAREGFAYVWLTENTRAVRSVRELSFGSAAFSDLRTNGTDPCTVNLEISGRRGSIRGEPGNLVTDHRDSSKFLANFSMTLNDKPLDLGRRIQGLRLGIVRPWRGSTKLKANWTIPRNDLSSSQQSLFLTPTPTVFGPIKLTIGATNGPALILHMKNLGADADLRSGIVRYYADVTGVEMR
jgi:hypothetical protein